jgi:RNA polymerase sigma factor (sigma-70 family)
MDAQQSTMAEHWATVERVITFVCRKLALRHEDAEDFASTVKLRLLQDGDAILSRFRGQSGLATYLTVVIRRMYFDQRIHETGKWHASAEATRLGAPAVELERAIFDRGMATSHAVAVVHEQNPESSVEELEALAARLPQRLPRRSMVPLDGIEEVVAAQEATDLLALTHERQTIGTQAASVVRAYLARLESSDRLMLQLQFESNMQLSQIARMLGVEQKPLYRRRERLLRDLRASLEEAGITARDAVDLIGQLGTDLDFGLETSQSRPSTLQDGMTRIEEISR